MLRPILEFLFAIGLIVGGYFFAGNNMQPELFGMAIGFAGALIVDVIVFLVEERKLLKLYIDCLKPSFHPELRLTIAYLFRIEVQGRYLLIKSNRIANTFQPVGGVYKYFDPEAKEQLNKIGVSTDNNIANDDVSEFDLRLKMHSRKKIRKFLKWFWRKENRECDPWREFYEELIEPGILPKNDFPYIHYELVGQHFEPIHYDKHFKIDTFKYADIFTPKFLNHKQVDAVKALTQVGHSEYIWVTRDEILRGKSDHGHLIAEHTYKIFHNTKLK